VTSNHSNLIQWRAAYGVTGGKAHLVNPRTSTISWCGIDTLDGQDASKRPRCKMCQAAVLAFVEDVSREPEPTRIDRWLVTIELPNNQPGTREIILRKLAVHATWQVTVVPAEPGEA